MTTRAYSVIAQGTGYKLVKWEGLTTDDDGEPFEITHHTDISLHVKGDFGAGAAVAIQGDNDPGESPTWPTLNDAQGNALSFTADKIEQVLENVHKIRPAVTGGTDPNLKVFMRIKG
jgi:hypothetical protein